MWAPVGVPNAADRACIEASGTYEVTLDQDAYVSQLLLGDPTGNAVLHLPHNLHIGFGLVAESGAELRIDPTGQTPELGAPWDPSASSGPAWFVSRGYVEVQDDCMCSLPDAHQLAELRGLGRDRGLLGVRCARPFHE